MPPVCRLFLLSIAAILATAATAAADGFSWSRYANKPDAWFRSDEGRRAVDNVLSHQSPRGSWSKNVDTTAEPYRGSPEKIRGTFDNGATRNEVRLLGRAFAATGDQRCEAAVLKALDHILEAQYANGGWPQYFPAGDGYNRHITFNDNTMVGLMELLREVAESEAFSFVDVARRRRAREAFDRGVECILKCQIVVDGTPTAWCAQHDSVTLKPAKARIYEHVSISGGESGAIVRLLMSIENPDARVIRAVESACRWFDHVKLTGIRQIERDGDKVLVADASAPPLWARFYEIGTNRPIFSGRDGVIRYDIRQIEAERRNGYAWYGTWPAKALAQWPAWRAKLAGAAE